MNVESAVELELELPLAVVADRRLPASSTVSAAGQDHRHHHHRHQRLLPCRLVQRLRRRDQDADVMLLHVDDWPPGVDRHVSPPRTPQPPLHYTLNTVLVMFVMKKTIRTVTLISWLQSRFDFNSTGVGCTFAVVDRGVGDWGRCPGHQGRGHQRGERENKNNANLHDGKGD